MWFSFWRSRDRFTLDELQYLVDQLQRVQIVNEVNKGFVVEALRSIAELMTYGDQHDPTFFEFFMEKEIMGEFVRILKISRITSVALQLLQTISIMIQNLRSEHAIYYMLSNEHINSLITYSYDFQNEELLGYYISFLRAISGKLNKSTISLLIKTTNDEIVSFPLYSEAIRHAFHEENMVRIAVRALTLNVYHVGDEIVNKYVSTSSVSDYFSKLVSYFKEQCLNLDKLVSETAKNPVPSDSSSCIVTSIEEIEDNLYYFSDVISAGIPELGRLITDNILELLIFPLLLPSLKEDHDDMEICATTSLYFLCCILHIVKTKELASSIATALFCLPEYFALKSDAKLNGHISNHCLVEEHKEKDESNEEYGNHESENSELKSPNSINVTSPRCASTQSNNPMQISLREVLLSYIVRGSDTEVLGSLSVLSTLLQTKELDESMLDGLGILPQRKQHKRLLLQALVGEGSGEEQLFSLDNLSIKDCINTELDHFLQKFKAQFSLPFCCGEFGVNPQLHSYQVRDALVHLFCRSNVSAEVLWAGGWLLRQLLPHRQAEFNDDHVKVLKDAYDYSISLVFEEINGRWCDFLITVLVDEWRNCKRAIEASLPQKNPKHILLPSKRCSSECESSITAAERMRELLKVLVLRRQLLIFSCGGVLSDLPPQHSLSNSPINSRAITAGLDVVVPKPGTEINLDNAVPCKIAFERGKERNFCFLAVSRGTSGWILLAEEFSLKRQRGIVRVAAPLGGSYPNVDEMHPTWLHLRIRPFTLPSLEPSKFNDLGKYKSKIFVDGRWTLAFQDESTCKSAESMALEELRLLRAEVENRLRTIVILE